MASLIVSLEEVVVCGVAATPVNFRSVAGIHAYLGLGEQRALHDDGTMTT